MTRTSKALQQWVVVDGKGRRTTVSLENIVAGVQPDPKLFKIDVRRRGEKALAMRLKPQISESASIQIVSRNMQFL